MQVTVSHPTYGLITYTESFWTGKKTILFDGIPLLKIQKNMYQLPASRSAEGAAEGASPLTVAVKGSYISGASLIVGDETIPLTSKPATSDYVLGILPGALFFALIMQGALGGGLAALMSFGGILLMKSRPGMKQKLLISLGASAVITAIGVALIIHAFYVLSLMQNM